MTISSWTETEDATDRRFASATGRVSPGLRRGLLLAALTAGALWAVYATDAADETAAVARAGAELTQLLRFMALVKAAIAMGVVTAVWWRLALPARPGWLFAYLAAGAGMAAGPVLIWDLAHVGLGALLLHGGLFTALVALWRDPAVAAKLGAMVEARRRGLTDRAGRLVRPMGEAAAIAVARSSRRAEEQAPGLLRGRCQPPVEIDGSSITSVGSM